MLQPCIIVKNFPLRPSQKLSPITAYFFISSFVQAIAFSGERAKTGDGAVVYLVGEGAVNTPERQRFIVVAVYAL